METQQVIHCHWFRCKNSHSFHLVLDNAILTFSPEQLLIVANAIDQIRHEILNTDQIIDASLNSNVLM